MKKFLIIPLAVFGLCLCACSSNADNSPKDNVTSDSLASAIRAQIKAELISSGADAEKSDEDILPDYRTVFLTNDGLDLPISLDTECLEDAVVIIHKEHENADLIAVLKAREGKTAEAEEIARTIYAYQLEQADSYLHAQMQKLEKSIVRSVGNYIIYIAYHDPKPIEDAIMRVIR